MMTRLQLRMARAALGWGVRDLADKAGVSPNTVSRFENGAGARVDTVVHLQEVLERPGSIFVPADEVAGPGVRMREPKRKSSRKLPETALHERRMIRAGAHALFNALGGALWPQGSMHGVQRVGAETNAYRRRALRRSRCFLVRPIRGRLHASGIASCRRQPGNGKAYPGGCGPHTFDLIAWGPYFACGRYCPYASSSSSSGTSVVFIGF